MIKVLSTQQIPGANYCTWQEFQTWLWYQKEYQFDIETNVTDWWCTKEVKTLQFGDLESTLQYVLEWAILTDEQKQIIKSSLEDWSICKLIQNAQFEYIVMRFHGMEIHNMYCTLTAEKVLNGGIELMNYSLSDLTEKYLDKTLDKSLQTSFGDGILTLEKIKYAATDCMYLAEIRRQQLESIMAWKDDIVQDPTKVLELEMNALHAFADFTYYGVELDIEKWRENIKLAEPVIESSRVELENWVKGDERLRMKAIELGYYLLEDRVEYNLNSPAQKSELLKLIFPDIIGGTQNVIKAYIRDNGPRLSSELLGILVDLQSKVYTSLSVKLLEEHREYLITKGYLLPAGTFSINWNSTDQVLALVKSVEPKLKNLSADAVAKTTHPIFNSLENYKDSLKLTTTYGESFIQKHVEPDGKVRSSFNPVVSTGRSSSAKPNVQNIPVKESSKEIVDNWLAAHPGKLEKDFTLRYRNAFICGPDEVYVDSDYTGQELGVIAEIAKDELWFQTIMRGEDLHSVTAAMVFASKWETATEAGCVYKSSRQKCKCSGHKKMRTAVKTINFG